MNFNARKSPLREIRKRNSRYQLAGIRPIWILGANLFQRKGKRYLSVNPFILTFLHQFRSSQPTALYFYCPDSNIMIQASDLHLISPHRAIACFSYFPLSAIRFTDIFHHFSFQRPMLIRHWFQEKRTFRLRKRTYAKGRGKQWQHWLYQQRSTIDNLPAVVYLPVPSAYLFHTALWDWQSRICLGLLQYVPLNAHFTTTACEELLQNQLQAPSNFPMVKPLQHPISEYLSILCQLQIIKEEKPGCFRKVKELQQAKNIESALHEDQKLLNILLRQ
ncbi:competence protein CoiA family protein [Virgibacillus halophilus]|uniref:Competence protein CoiA family protein n=1 Tax=Tigheibacillus halophilus TaxID=361280 RepID=A0ABU5C9T7_9BACI|nr:competence protein CoiA family protein [Virgibacillus halophilus]